jgi:hypothetical protein
MIKRLIVGCCLVSTLAFSQAVVTYNLTVTSQEIDLIGKVLNTQPFGDVAPLVNKLQSQIVEQNKKNENKAVEPIVDPKK